MFLLHKKRSAMDRTAADKNYVAEATRRRRRILRAGFFFIILCMTERSRVYEGNNGLFRKQGLR